MHIFFVKGMEVLDLLRHPNCSPSLPHALYRYKQASPSLVIKRSVSGASRDFLFSFFFFFSFHIYVDMQPFGL